MFSVKYMLFFINYPYSERGGRVAEADILAIASRMMEPRIGTGNFWDHGDFVFGNHFYANFGP